MKANTRTYNGTIEVNNVVNTKKGKDITTRGMEIIRERIAGIYDIDEHAKHSHTSKTREDI